MIKKPSTLPRISSYNVTDLTPETKLQKPRIRTVQNIADLRVTSPSVPTFHQEKALKNVPANRNEHSRRVAPESYDSGRYASARYNDGKVEYTASPPRQLTQRATAEPLGQPRTSVPRKLSRTLPPEDVTRGENKRRDTEAKTRYREEQFFDETDSGALEKGSRIDPQISVALASFSPREGEPILLQLPHVTLMHILSYLSCKELCTAGIVSRRFKMLCDENELWKNVIAREWANKRMLKGYGRKHVLYQKNNKTKKISQQLIVIDYKQELKNHILFKRSCGKQTKAARKKASVWSFSKRDQYILMLGLDQSGKTTILYDAKAGRHELIHSLPTVGFNSEELEILGQGFAIWDVGGLQPMRNTWAHYMASAILLIWVLDSSDEDRVKESRVELHRVLRDESLKTRKLLVLANKQDRPGALDARTVARALQLDSPQIMESWDWYVQPCSTCTGSGREALLAGLEWLVHWPNSGNSNSALGGAGAGDDSNGPAQQQDSLWQKLKASFM